MTEHIIIHACTHTCTQTHTHARTGNSSYAVSLWREAIAINPMHSEAMAGLARALRSLGRNEEAEEMFQRLW